MSAAYGTEGFNADHLDAMRTYGIERVPIAYDRDAAGDKAADALAAVLIAEGVKRSRVLFLAVRPPTASPSRSPLDDIALANRRGRRHCSCR